MAPQSSRNCVALTRMRAASPLLSAGHAQKVIAIEAASSTVSSVSRLISRPTASAGKIDEIGKKADRDHEFAGGEGIRRVHETRQIEVEEGAHVGSGRRVHRIFEAVERRCESAQSICAPGPCEINRYDRRIDRTKPH
jgi:hypothetical protein